MSHSDKVHPLRILLTVVVAAACGMFALYRMFLIVFAFLFAVSCDREFKLLMVAFAAQALGAVIFAVIVSIAIERGKAGFGRWDSIVLATGLLIGLAGIAFEWTHHGAQCAVPGLST